MASSAHSSRKSRASTPWKKACPASFRRSCLSCRERIFRPSSSRAPARRRTAPSNSPSRGPSGPQRGGSARAPTRRNPRSPWKISSSRDSRRVRGDAPPFMRQAKRATFSKVLSSPWSSKARHAASPEGRSLSARSRRASPPRRGCPSARVVSRQPHPPWAARQIWRGRVPKKVSAAETRPRKFQGTR